MYSVWNHAERNFPLGLEKYLNIILLKNVNIVWNMPEKNDAKIKNIFKNALKRHEQNIIKNYWLH